MGLNGEELRVLEQAAALWTALNALPNQHPCDKDEHMRDIHNIQNRVMARLVVRAHPDFFSQGEEG